ncbi:uncharacterized protein BKA55DRAFT_556696 [Fusarium redolens]|uniref:Uncharacterized protein n=1 Tax=Fusarium redolens TaxID=48865 RepID=A0A9P9R7D8_FUSRE|nr:uncharacterized protein BKA55DRAFT_556696 [Fusarium redolens]KAH7267865.1 hypothetical protein BKA55DRAFT_556696 [Fusarium redolens]
MADGEKICFLRIGLVPELGKGLRAQALVADLPSKGSISSLTLRGPYDISTKTSVHMPGSTFPAAVPVYDYDQSEIIWAVHNTDDDHYAGEFNSEDCEIHIWRLGPHFSLSSIESTSLTATYPQSPGLILENGTISVGVLNGDQYCETPSTLDLARRGYDHKWTKMPLNTTSKSSNGQTGFLFKPPFSNLKYIFFLQSHKDYSTVLQIDAVKENKFAELGGSSVLWQHYEVDFGFPIKRNLEDEPGNTNNGNFGAIVLQDEKSGKSRLYIFKLGHAEIHYAYIPLRKDGSIDSYNATFKASGKQTIEIGNVSPFQGPCLLQTESSPESEGKLIILWNHENDDFFLKGYSGAIKPNGMAPNGDEWTEIKFPFDQSQGWNNRHYTSWSALIIPGSYE